MNIFEEKVFPDTTYTICSLQFTLSNQDNQDNQDNEYKLYSISCK